MIFLQGQLVGEAFDALSAEEKLKDEAMATAGKKRFTSEKPGYDTKNENDSCGSAEAGKNDDDNMKTALKPTKGTTDAESPKAPPDKATKLLRKGQECSGLIETEKPKALASQRESSAIPKKRPQSNIATESKSQGDGRRVDRQASATNTQRIVPPRIGKSPRSKGGGTRQLKPIRLTDTRLSRYIYPSDKKGAVSNVSPIFHLLQDPAKLGTARELLRHESAMVQLKIELSELEKEKNQPESGILNEKRLKDSYKKELKDFDAEYNNLQGVWGLFNAALGWWEKDSDDEVETTAPESIQNTGGQESKTTPEEAEEARILEARRVIQERRAEEVKAKAAADEFLWLEKEEKEGASVLEDAMTLKKVAVDYLHPEVPVIATEPTVFGRNYFGRFSAPEQIPMDKIELQASFSTEHSDDDSSESEAEISEDSNEELSEDSTSSSESELGSGDGEESELKPDEEKEEQTAVDSNQKPELKRRGRKLKKRSRRTERRARRKLRDPPSAPVDEEAKVLEREEAEVMKEVARAMREERIRIKEAVRVRKKREAAEKARKMSRAEKANRMKQIEKERKRIQTQLDEIPARIESLKLESLRWDEPIHVKQREMSNLRAKISSLKGDGTLEDENFHIDNSRDERGQSFLMVATQNNDIETARLCFSLKANPDVTSPEGFTGASVETLFRSIFVL